VMNPIVAEHDVRCPTATAPDPKGRRRDVNFSVLPPTERDVGIPGLSILDAHALTRGGDIARQRAVLGRPPGSRTVTRRSLDHRVVSELRNEVRDKPLIGSPGYACQQFENRRAILYLHVLGPLAHVYSSFSRGKRDSTSPAQRRNHLDSRSGPCSVFTKTSSTYPTHPIDAAPAPKGEVAGTNWVTIAID